MPKRHRGPYPPEFRARLIELVRAGRTPESLAKDFEPTAQAIRNWVRQADLDAGSRTDGVTTDEREELAPSPRSEDAARRAGDPKRIRGLVRAGIEVTPTELSQSASACRSPVKLLNDRTGCVSRSGGTATT